MIQIFFFLFWITLGTPLCSAGQPLSVLKSEEGWKQHQYGARQKYKSYQEQAEVREQRVKWAESLQKNYPDNCLDFLQFSPEIERLVRGYLYDNTSAEIESEEQRSIREQFIQAQEKNPDNHLAVLGFPHELEELVREYLYDPQQFRMSLGETSIISCPTNSGVINVLVASSRGAIFSIFQFSDYSLAVSKLGKKSIENTVFLRGLAAPVVAVAASPDGKYLYSREKNMHRDHRIGRLWNLETGQCIQCKNSYGDRVFFEPVFMGENLLMADDYSVQSFFRNRPRGAFFKTVGIDRLIPTVQLPQDDDGDALQQVVSWPVISVPFQEQVLTLQGLDNVGIFLLSEHQCLLYKPNMIARRVVFSFDELGTKVNCFGNNQPIPVGLLAGRISLQKKNRLFLLTEWGLLTYFFDYTKQDRARLLSTQRFTQVHFSKPANTILSDDGVLCATVTSTTLEVWHLPTETLVYRCARSGNETIPTGKLVLHTNGNLAVVDDVTKKITYFISDADIESHMSKLPMQACNFVEKVAKKHVQIQDVVTLDPAERAVFSALPGKVQKSVALQNQLITVEQEDPARNQLHRLHFKKEREWPWTIACMCLGFVIGDAIRYRMGKDAWFAKLWDYVSCFRKHFQMSHFLRRAHI